MKLRIPEAARIAIVFAVAFFYCLSVLSGWLDWAYWLFIIPIALVVGWFVGGVSYGILISRQAIKAAKEQMKRTRASQPGGDSPKQKAVGYFIWNGLVIAGALAIAIGYKIME